MPLRTLAASWVPPSPPALPRTPVLQFVGSEIVENSKAGTAGNKAIAIDTRVPTREFWKILAASIFYPNGGSKFALAQLVIGGGSNFLQLYQAYALPTIITNAGSDYFANIRGPIWAKQGQKITLETRVQGTETVYGVLNIEVWSRL